MLGYKVDDSGREDYNRGIDQTKQKQQSLTASILKASAITKLASSAVGAAFGFIRDSVIGATAETERYRVSLGTMLGDQERANRIIRDLDYGEGMFEGSAISDFYGTANSIGGLENLVMFGIEAEKAGDILNRLGDIANGNSEAFVSMSNKMGQIYAKGKADSTDLRSFVMRGFDVVGVIAEQTGRSREEIEKTGVSYEDTAMALRVLTDEGGRYHNMLQKQMNTIGGILKQFASFKAATAESIGFGVNEDLKDLLKYILEIAKAGEEVFVDKFVKAIRTVISWIFQIIIMWEVLGYRLEDMGDAFEPVKNFFSDLHDAGREAFTGLMILFVEIAKLIVSAFKPIQAFASPIIRELGAIAKDVFTTIANLISPLNSTVANSAGLFSVLGNIISGLLRPILGVAVAIKGVNTAIAIGKGAIATIKSIQVAYGLLAGTMSVMKAAADGNRLAMFMLEAQLIKTKIVLIAKTVATKVATAAQAIYNAVLMANPIALIILGIIAAIAAIVALVIVIKKNWEAIVSFFKMIGAKIKEGFLAIVEFIKKNAMTILNVILMILFFPVGIIMAVVRLIIKHWDTIGPKIKAIWQKIKVFFVNLGRQIANIFKTIVDAVANIWNSIYTFFIGLWNGIIDTIKTVWTAIKGWFSGLVEGIQNIWRGIIGFFSGLWEAIKQGPAEAIEYIRNAFINLFNSLQEKLFGFINKIREGWETVKGFFGGIAGGVANFFSGGSGGGGSPEPAYAGATPRGAAAAGVGQSTNYASHGGSSVVNANTSINVSVPPGTTREQSEAISRQVNAEFDSRLAGSINSSRANIPSPEVRRR